MKAVILVGGEGTRLRPLTYNTVKAMVPVLNRPFLEHVIYYLRSHGIDDIIFALCYLPNLIQNYFGDGSQWDVRFLYKVEGAPLGTAGAVKNVEEYLNEPFFVFNGDIFTDLDLTAMMSFHHRMKARVTIALTTVDNPTEYGVIETGAGGRIKRFMEKPGWDQVTSNQINAGVYIMEPDILAHIPPDTYFMFEHHVFPVLQNEGEPLFAYYQPAYWIDMGTPEKYLQLNHDLLNGKSSSKINIAAKGGLEIGSSGHIDPTARIEGPVVLGDNCVIGSRVRLKGPIVIGSGCRIGDDAGLEGSVLWQNVQLAERVTLKNCIVANNSHIEADSYLEEGSVLSDNVVVTRGSRLEQGSRILPGTVVGKL